MEEDHCKEPEVKEGDLGGPYYSLHLQRVSNKEEWKEYQMVWLSVPTGRQNFARCLFWSNYCSSTLYKIVRKEVTCKNYQLWDWPQEKRILSRCNNQETNHGWWTLPFEWQKSSGSTKATIGSLKDLQPGQLRTVSGMARNLTNSKIVKTKASRHISVRECQLTDPTGSVKLVMRDSSVDEIQEGRTYVLNNVLLKREGAILSLVTSQSGCSIEQCNIFPNITPPDPLPSTKKHHFEVIGTTTSSSYKVCTNCSKKVVLDGSKATVECQHCGATMSTNKSANRFYARVIL